MLRGRQAKPQHDARHLDATSMAGGAVAAMLECPVCPSLLFWLLLKPRKLRNDVQRLGIPAFDRVERRVLVRFER
jgi:hypothetical protein